MPQRADALHPQAPRGSETLYSQFSELCQYALIAEVSATPKPGLVDLHDSGAHRDMCFETFQASAAAITPYLTRMFAMGDQWPDRDGIGLFEAIRPVGIEAEKAMFAATGGVNTHKGMIFSMGTVAAAAGLFYHRHGCFRAEEILDLAGSLCRHELECDFKRIDREHPKTHGEILYVTYGQKGIRGEAQEGFPSIRLCSLPAMRELRKTCADDNQVYINTLLALMSHVDDTNVLIRTGAMELAYEKAEAMRILKLGGALTDGGMAALVQANRDFIHRNISPGGCADLLAVTIFLWNLEQYEEEKDETTN